MSGLRAGERAGGGGAHEAGRDELHERRAHRVDAGASFAEGQGVTRMPLAPDWHELDRDAAALETLELAIGLHEAGRSLALVFAVGLAAWRYLAERARRNRKGRSADLELVEVVREALGHGFDATWARQRATELTDDLHRYETVKGVPPLLRVHSWSPVLALLCAIADCQRVLGRTSPKLDAWRERQTTLALQACVASPDVIARIAAIRTAATGGEGS
jgi:hypothetical protein